MYGYMMRVILKLGELGICTCSWWGDSKGNVGSWAEAEAAAAAAATAATSGVQCHHYAHRDSPLNKHKGRRKKKGLNINTLCFWYHFVYHINHSLTDMVSSKI